MQNLLSRVTWLHPRSSTTAKVPLAPACLEGPLTQLSTAFAELLLWAKLSGESGQLAPSILLAGSMLTAPILSSMVVCSLQGRHPGISFLPCVQPHTHENSLPMSCLFICLFNKYLSTGCARNCRLPGDEAMKTSDPVCVLLEPSQADEFMPLVFFFFF